MNKYVGIVSLVLVGFGMSLIGMDTVKMTKNPLYNPLTQDGKFIGSSAYPGSLRYEVPRGRYARETYVQPGKRYTVQIIPVHQRQWRYGVEVTPFNALVNAPKSIHNLNQFKLVLAMLWRKVENNITRLMPTVKMSPDLNRKVNFALTHQIRQLTQDQVKFARVIADKLAQQFDRKTGVALYQGMGGWNAQDKLAYIKDALAVLNPNYHKFLSALAHKYEKAASFNYWPNGVNLTTYQGVPGGCKPWYKRWGRTTQHNQHVVTQPAQTSRWKFWK